MYGKKTMLSPNRKGGKDTKKIVNFSIGTVTINKTAGMVVMAEICGCNSASPKYVPRYRWVGLNSNRVCMASTLLLRSRVTRLYQTHSFGGSSSCERVADFNYTARVQYDCPICGWIDDTV